MAVQKLLIWDFDGTLGFRVGGMWSAALREIIAEEAPRLNVTADLLRPYLQSGFPWHRPHEPHTELRTPSEWWDTLDPLFVRALESVGIEPIPALRMARRVRSVYPDPARWRLFDDSLAALDQLTRDGWSHVILSNHVPELPGLLQHLNLMPRVVRAFGSAETGYEKPHPMAYQTVLEAFPRATRSWMIGDSMEIDIEGAKSVGIPGILVRRYHAEASHQCPALAEIRDLIAGAP